jgi:F-type H+-transporting ATPase subunit b
MHLDWWTIGLQTVNFAVLVWLLHRFLYRPVLGMIDARKAEIERQYADAKAAQEKAMAEFAGIEAQRATIAAERETALKSAAGQAQEIATARRKDAEREAQALLADARTSLASERAHAFDEARRLALDLGSEFAQRLLAQVPAALRAEAWIERIEQYIDALPKPECDALARQLATGNALAVVTATALPASAADAWRERLRRRLGQDISVSFADDPRLVAGAELHFPTTMLRFSWQSALDAARSEIGGHADAR